MANKKKRYWLMVRKHDGEVSKHWLSIHDDNETAAQKAAIAFLMTGKVEKVQVVFKRDDFNPAKVIVSFFLDGETVMFKRGPHTGPVSSSGNVPSGGVFLND